jgi:acetyl-CoA carboxylase biotin carboxyl carrier protein
MPAEIRAPMPGKIVQVLKSIGSQVNKGETIMVMEAMKMEMPVVANETGMIRDLPVKADEAVAKGAILVVIE